jgi:hypothetical protein
MTSSETTKYPLLEEILSSKEQPLQPMYTIRDIARLFSVSVRAIQNRVSSGQLPARDLPGRARLLSQDLEIFLSTRKRKAARRDK